MSIATIGENFDKVDEKTLTKLMKKEPGLLRALFSVYLEAQEAEDAFEVERQHVRAYFSCHILDTSG